VTNTLSIGKKLPIADPSMKELEGYIPVTIGVKKIEIIDHPRKRQSDLRWADQEEDEDEDEYIWQEGQWCPRGLRKSKKRRVQRLRNRELRQAGTQKRQVWRPKDKPEGSNRSAPACMVYFQPNEFMAPANEVVQEETSLEVNDDEQLGGLMAQLVLAKQATFDKPARNRHMRPLYLKGYVKGKPLTKMFVDGGAAVNVCHTPLSGNLAWALAT
jgi:hypothetical protein